MESGFLRGILAKRSHLQLLLNEWHITQGTQPEIRVLCLESHCYNKSCLGPMLSTSPRLDGHKPFLVCFKSLLDFPKWHLHIVHSQPSVLLVSHISSSHIVVAS
jgi:hypothetical protein